MTTNQRKKLLVLEEGPSISRSIAAEAERRGFDLVSYRDATGVLVMARQLQADAMLIDSQLRGAGSLVALKGFRRHVNLTALPMIVVLGRNGPREQELLDAGATACVPEGMAALALFDRIQEHEQEPLDFTMAPREILEDPARLEAVAEVDAAVPFNHPAFEKLSQLASELLVSPISLASLISGTSQIYKGQVGLDQELVAEGEVGLAHTFCQWVVSANDALVVDDAREHRVLKESPLARDLGVIAYAGMPVSGRDNLPVGALCAIDTRARNWTPEDLSTLQDLASVANAYCHWSPARGREAIVAATRMVRRYAQRLRDSEGRALLDIVDEQALRLAPAAA